MKVMFNICSGKIATNNKFNHALLVGAACDFYERWERPVDMGDNKSGFVPAPTTIFVAGSDGDPGSLLIAAPCLVAHSIWEKRTKKHDWMDMLKLEGFHCAYRTWGGLPDDIWDIIEEDLGNQDPVYIFQGSRHAIRERLETAATLQAGLKDEKGEVLFPHFHVMEWESTSSAPFWETGVIPDRVRVGDDPTPIAAWLTREMDKPLEEQHPKAKKFLEKWYIDTCFGVLVAQSPNGTGPKYVYLGGTIAKIGFEDGNLQVVPALSE